MLWAKNSRYGAGGYWRCNVKQRAYRRETARRSYDALDGVGYNRYLLKNRRTKALARMRAREAA